MRGFAVIPITTYKDWLKNGIRRGARVNLHRAEREGVVVRPVSYDDHFVQGIKDLYDETPIRQGKPFWHHGKNFEDIKKIHGTYRERAEYIGAYFEGELIGFLKMVLRRQHRKNHERHRQREILPQAANKRPLIAKAG